MLSVGSIIEIPWIFSINRDGRQRLPLRSYFPGAAKPRRGDRLADATLEFLKVFFLLATKGPPVMALMKSNKSSVIKCRGGASFGWGWGGGEGIDSGAGRALRRSRKYVLTDGESKGLTTQRPGA